MIQWEQRKKEAAEGVRMFYSFEWLLGGPMQGWQLAVLMLAAAVAVLVFCAWCRIFKKAGLPWERMFVPVYGSYWTYAVAQGGGLFAAKLLLTVMFILSSYYVGSRSLFSTGIDGLWLLCMAGYFIGITVIHWLRCARLADAFARGRWFALGMFFFFPAYLAFLAFGPCRFYGDDGVPTGGIGLPAAWVCPYCGTANPARRDACENCGRNVSHM